MSIVHFSSKSSSNSFRAIDVEVSRKRERVICSSLLSRRRLKWAEKEGEGRGSRSRRRGNLKLTYVGAALSPAPRTTCGSKQMVSTVPQCHTLHPARS